MLMSSQRDGEGNGAHQHISLNSTLDVLEDWNSVLRVRLVPYTIVIIDEIS
jgi:hypothetical protein